MLTVDEARLRVARGAAHLDQIRPGWHEQIDTGTLTMINPCGCIVGQLCGDYNRDLWKLIGGLGDSFFVSQTYGFNLPFEWNEGQPTVAWLSLQDAWIEAIAARKFPDAPAPAMEIPASRFLAVARTVEQGEAVHSR